MTTQPSTPQSNIELIRKAFSALGRKDVDAVVKLMPSDFIINIAGMPYQKRGADAWRKHAEILFSAFPDIQIKIEDIFSGEDKVAVRVRFTGTHAGEFLGIQPTGKKIGYEQRAIPNCRWKNCRGVDLLRHAYADGPNRGARLFDGQARIDVACWLSGMVRAFSRSCHRRTVNGDAAPHLVLIRADE